MVKINNILPLNAMQNVAQFITSFPNYCRTCIADRYTS